jgi:hypothetical protein
MSFHDIQLTVLSQYHSECIGISTNGAYINVCGGVGTVVAAEELEARLGGSCELLCNVTAQAGYSIEVLRGTVDQLETREQKCKASSCLCRVVVAFGR